MAHEAGDIRRLLGLARQDETRTDLEAWPRDIQYNGGSAGYPSACADAEAMTLETHNYPTKLLFVCSQNRFRSLTAETIFDGVSGLQVRSVGTQPNARVVVTEGHI